MMLAFIETADQAGLTVNGLFCRPTAE